MCTRDTNKARELSQLRRQNDELKHLNSTKDEFIALASHQLRTPATSVKQYLGMLLEGYMGTVSSSQREFLQKAYDNNERQLNTINDLLQVAQLDADKVVLNSAPCDIAELLAGAIQDQRGVAKNRGQRIVFTKPAQGPVLVYADALRLRMVFDNVIDNASKYSDTHQNITIALSATDELVGIAVTDHGVGIAVADYPRLFQKFSRIDNPRSIMVGGNGLGLYLAKKIMKVHGGDITVSSVLGKGSVFTVTLPRYRSDGV